LKEKTSIFPNLLLSPNLWRYGNWTGYG